MPSYKELDEFAGMALSKPHENIPGLPRERIVEHFRTTLRAKADREDCAIFLSSGKQGAAVGILQDLPWDTEHFGCRCAKIDIFLGGETSGGEPRSATSRILSEVVGHARDRGCRFVWSKCPAEFTSLAHSFESLGFRLMDCELTLVLFGDGDFRLTPAKSAVRIESVRKREIPEIAEIGICFRQSRFHADDNIASETADLLWRKSVSNACSGFADEVFVAFDGDRPVGLVSCFDDELLGNNSTGAIRSFFHVGVLPEYQKKGVGSSLVVAAITDSVDSAAIRVETQSRNFAALKLYQAHGFHIVSSHYGFHAWL